MHEPSVSNIHGNYRALSLVLFQRLVPAVAESYWAESRGLSKRFGISWQCHLSIQRHGIRPQQILWTHISARLERSDITVIGQLLLRADSRRWHNVAVAPERQERNEAHHFRQIFSCRFAPDFRSARNPAQMRQKKINVSQLPKSEHWETSPYMKAGVHPVTIPYDWSPYGETLVLADHEDFDLNNKMAVAIFAFSWAKSQVEVFPQDWFNTGDYDFGYQWITRVAHAVMAVSLEKASDSEASSLMRPIAE